MLTLMSMFSAAAAPMVSDYVEQAKVIRATHDVRTLGVVLTRLFNDVWGERHIEDGWASHDLLVGAGEVPVTRGAGTTRWATAPDSDAIDRLDDHLVSNGPGYRPKLPGALFGWRGAYVQKRVHADPWGHRYAVNSGAVADSGRQVIVLSAGADGIVETPFDLQEGPIGGDDIVAILTPATYHP